jgi:hypothetical protein
MSQRLVHLFVVAFFCLLNVQCRLRTSPSLRDRSALLSHSTPTSGRSSPFRGHTPGNGSSYPNQYSTNQQPQLGTRYADDLENQNDEMLEGLSAKVKLLKDVRASFVWIILAIRLKKRVISFLSFFFADFRWYWKRSSRISCSVEPNGTLCPLMLTLFIIISETNRTTRSQKRVVSSQALSDG